MLILRKFNQMLKTRIKVSKVENLTDARYFAAMGADYLGFCCNTGTEYFCSPARIKEIASWVEGPVIVPEFEGWQEESEVRELLESGIGGAVHFGILADYTGRFGVPVFRDFIFENTIAGEAVAGTEFPVIRTDTPYSSLNDDSIKRIQSLALQHKVFLDLPFQADELPEILEKLPVYGLILRGGKEEKTGFKSFAEMDRIFMLLET